MLVGKKEEAEYFNAPQVKFEDIDVINKIQFPELSRKPVVFFDKR